jgi:hypothetical protein
VFDREFVAARFVPEGEFDAIPESKFVIDDAQIVFYDILGRAHHLCDFTVLESLSDKSDYSPLSLVWSTFSVALPSRHSGLHMETVQAFIARSYGKKISISQRDD